MCFAIHAFKGFLKNGISEIVVQQISDSMTSSKSPTLFVSNVYLLPVFIRNETRLGMINHFFWTEPSLNPPCVHFWTTKGAPFF